MECHYLYYQEVVTVLAALQEEEFASFPGVTPATVRYHKRRHATAIVATIQERERASVTVGLGVKYVSMANRSVRLYAPLCGNRTKSPVKR